MTFVTHRRCIDAINCAWALILAAYSECPMFHQDRAKQMILSLFDHFSIGKYPELSL